MNEETTGTLFEYPYNQFLMVRLEFVLLTEDELEAKIMRIVEVEMLKLKAAWQKKCYQAMQDKQPLPPEPEEYWVTIPQCQFITQLYKCDTGQVGAKHPNSLSKTTLRRALKSLLEEKQFLRIRSKPGEEFGAPQYTLNRSLIQAKLRLLPKNPLSIFMGLSNLETGGVSNLESPSVSNLETGSLQKGKSPSSNLESPQFPNWKVIKDSNKDNKKIDEDSEYDATVAPPVPSDAPVVASPAPLFDSSPSEVRIASEMTTASTPSEQKKSTAKKSTASKPSTSGGVTLTPEGEAVLERWQQLRKNPIPLNKGIIEAANALGPCNPSKDDLHEVEMHCYKTDKTGYFKRGVKLWDIAREYESWLSIREQQARREAPQTAMAHSDSNGGGTLTSSSTSFDPNQYVTETMRQAQLMKEKYGMKKEVTHGA